MENALIKYDCGCEKYGIVNLKDWQDAFEKGFAGFRQPTEVEYMAGSPDVVILDHCDCRACQE